MPDLSTILTVGFAVLSSVISSWYLLTKVIVRQFEKNLDERFTNLAEQRKEDQSRLNDHFEHEEVWLKELQRIETEGLRARAVVKDDVHRLENDIQRVRAEAAEKYLLRSEANTRHDAVITAIQDLGKRIDRFFDQGK